MADEQKGNLKSKFGSSLLAGAQGLSDAPKTPKKAPSVRIARRTYANMLSTRILKNAALGLLVILVVYFAFAVTIMRVLPTTSVGLLPVKNITFEGGLVPAGEVVVLSMTQPQGEEITDYLKQSVVPTTDAAIVKVIAGPWGAFEWSPPGIVAVNDQIVENVVMAEPSDQELTSEYLVECLSGSCVAGQAYVIPSNHLLGVPLSDKE
jgi:hypothetical protein